LTRSSSCPVNRWRSDSLTVVEVPEGIDSNKIVKTAYAKYDLSLGIGLAGINGKVSGGAGGRM
jgi:alanine-glyoxylate transaminase/serine-glyoxylate transaminase/serine-pyruvate transaminase